MEPLASHRNWKSQSNTNVSTSISLIIFDKNRDEIPIEIIIARESNLYFIF